MNALAVHGLEGGVLETDAFQMVDVPGIGGWR